MTNKLAGLRQCIWCEQVKHFHPKPTLSKFDREHVLPDSFGKFGSTNLTLIGFVCKECNGNFGRGLDQTLSRGGIEGYLRLKKGQKPASELRDFRAETLPLHIVDPLDSSWNGARVHLETDGESVFEAISIQVGFRQASGNWLRLSESEIDDLDSPLDLGLPIPTEISFYTAPTDVRIRIINKLRLKGFIINDIQETAAEMKRVAAIYLLDQERQRAITKIAINYLAKLAEGNFEHMLFAEEISAIKRYVLTGASPGYNPITQGEPIAIIDNGHSDSPIEGHLITLGFYNYLGRNQLICRISLYNCLPLHIFLSTDYKGIVIPLHVGHYWSINDRECRKILPLNTTGNSI